MFRSSLSPILAALLEAGPMSCSDDSGKTPDSAVDMMRDARQGDGPAADAPIAEAGAEAGADATSADAPVPITMTGIVEDGSTEVPIQGATVSEVGASPPNTTTTNAQGQYSLTVTGSEVTLRAEKQTYLSAQKLVKTTSNSTGLPLVTPALVSSFASGAGLPAFDPTKGVVAVDLAGAAVGQAVSMVAANSGSVVLDASDTPVKGNAVLTTNNRLVVFINVAPGVTQLTFSPAGKCTLPLNDYPVDANVLTAVDAICTP